MYIRKMTPKLGALIVIALLASGGTSALADGRATLSGSDVLDQAVALYEKLQNAELEIPAPLSEQGLEEHLLKSVVLGFVNLDDTETVAQEPQMSKQDVMTVLYKTIINYDESYTISEEEANDILNECYDNACINEENRLAYAFMIKQGIISDKTATNPDKAITWDSCRILVDLIYDYFIQDTTVTVNDAAITIGSNVNNVLEAFGNPNRIDKSDFGFEWYVYNTDYSKLVMVGVEGGRICALYTNSDNFEYEGIKSGDDYSEAENTVKEHLKFLCDSDDKVEAIIYNPRSNGQEEKTDINRVRSRELLDMINAYRAKHGLNTYVFSDELANNAWLASVDYMNGMATNGAYQAEAYSIFDIYEKLIYTNCNLVSGKYKKGTAVGISVPIENSTLYASAVIDGEKQIKRSVEKLDADEMPLKEEESTEKLFGLIPVVSADVKEEAEKVDEIKTPEFEEIAPNEFNEGEDIVLNLKEKVSNRYKLAVYNVEEEEYVINSYITIEDTQITVPSDVLKRGCDYNITVSSVTEEGEELSGETILVSYGSAYDNGVTIIGPSSEEDYTTDNDYIPLQWASELYHDFYVDVYNSDGEMIVNTIVEDEDSAIIRGLDPGDYYVYITALRRGTIVEKSQDMLHVTITMPKPVVNEFILDKDDKYYFVYEDSALGVLYFYDEEIIEVKENGKTTKKKKIIQKQVKSTKAYRQLAQYRDKVEYTTGDTAPHLSTNERGLAIVEEAKKYLGVQYVWGGSTPNGFDCSGLVQYAYKAVGIDISRVTYTQIEEGIAVPKSELAPGDLVFFEKNGDVHHVGIYVGNDEFIHAPHTGDVVKISSLDEAYYAEQYCGARRIY